MAACFQCDRCFTFLVDGPGEGQVECQSYLIHIYDVWSDGILCYLCWNEFVKMCDLFLVVWRELLIVVRVLMDRPYRFINLRHHDRPPFKSWIFFPVAIVFAFSLICTVERPRPSALCSPSLQECLPVWATCFYDLWKLFPLFTLLQFFPLPFPASHHRFIYVKFTCSSSVFFFIGQLDCF